MDSDFLALLRVLGAGGGALLRMVGNEGRKADFLLVDFKFNLLLDTLRDLVSTQSVSLLANRWFVLDVQIAYTAQHLRILAVVAD